MSVAIYLLAELIGAGCQDALVANLIEACMHLHVGVSLALRARTLT